MDSVEKFAREAAAFERWLLSGAVREADAARECLIRLLDLYRAGIELPPEWSDELDGRADLEPVGEAEWRKAFEAARRLPPYFPHVARTVFVDLRAVTVRTPPQALQAGRALCAEPRRVRPRRS
jgi:hypothetical protein